MVFVSAGNQLPIASQFKYFKEMPSTSTYLCLIAGRSSRDLTKGYRKGCFRLPLPLTRPCQALRLLLYETALLNDVPEVKLIKFDLIFPLSTVSLSRYLRFVEHEHSSLIAEARREPLDAHYSERQGRVTLNSELSDFQTLL